MHPRTVAILVGSILLLGLIMRVVIYQTGLLPVRDMAPAAEECRELLSAFANEVAGGTCIRS